MPLEQPYEPRVEAPAGGSKQRRWGTWLGISIAAVGLVVVSGVVGLGLGKASERVRLFSDVESPTAAVIGDLAATARAGNCDLLRRKVELFDLRWQEFRESDSPLPSDFFREIINLE